MTETTITLKKDEISGLAEVKPLIKIQGTLTSQIQLRGKEAKEPYYYSFIRLKGQSIDLPVIFKIKEDDKLIKPTLKKNDKIELTGHYSNSLQNFRKSFTCHAYQLLNHKRIRKKCSGCLDTFTCSSSKNYDYCKNCELNDSRYSQNKCPECGGSSGTIKLPHQPLRNCKTCHLANQETKFSLDQKEEENIFTNHA